MKKLSALLLAAALALPSTSFAATDGTLGATSSGEVAVGLTVVARESGDAQITGLQDFAFGNVTENTTPTPITLNNICVYLTSAATYAIELYSTYSGTPNNGAMEGNGAQGARLNYTWKYSAGGVDVTGISGTGLSGSNTLGCTSGTKASLTLTPASATGLASALGDYVDSLTLTVSPE